ncbi:GDP-mannose mannosyl hydrolase [Pseudoalteromonas sp. BSi20429]|uniref:GDP-mannose mannosyl hydrolase n=1 Tax=Pseudoalteromonas sp. BSi20429 TaxID=1097676 RepID=UPI00023177D8|nr:GDP-mannose mannosyl hydrolase [Pseudoalteromonas sp. BSi20429]GAA68724.1 GDP-mannose mannosyl hydrolase wbdQ/wbhG [Pseudoalteromonas sp. BSi20429]
MFLEQAIFTTVIDSTPLVSIDLVVINENNQALLGKRLNRPAKDYWFVPGGRILKNESLEDAFKRLTKGELGEQYLINEASLLGPYDHFYDDCVVNEAISTHYVAIAYILKVKSNILGNLPIAEQHSNYNWLSIEELLNDNDVHKHTKWYFEAINTRGILE